MNLPINMRLHLGVNTLFFIPGDVGETETYLREMLLAMVEEYPELTLTLFTNLENDAVLRQILAEHVSVNYICPRFKAAVRLLRILLEHLLLPFAVLKSGLCSPASFRPLGYSRRVSRDGKCTEVEEYVLCK